MTAVLVCHAGVSYSYGTPKMTRGGIIALNGRLYERVLILCVGIVLGLSFNTGMSLSDLRLLPTLGKSPRRQLSSSVKVPVSTVEVVSKRRNIVLCLAQGPEYQGAAGLRWLARFGGSFRRFNNDAEIVFFTPGVDPALEDKLPMLSMQAEIFGDEPPPWNGMEVAARRWYLMRHYLEKRKDQLEGGWVLAIDARDSFFQGDPFAFPRAPGDELYAFLEGKFGADHAMWHNPLNMSKWNWDVIKACYNTSELPDSVKLGPVSCSGTVMASYAAMVSYMRLMEGEMLRTANDSVCNSTGGRDQGFHNVLLYSGALAKEMNVTLFNNRDNALVKTLDLDTTYLDFFGRVLNQRGERPAVVHQWDRSRHIFNVIDNKLFPYLREAEMRDIPAALMRRQRSREELEGYIFDRAKNRSLVR